MILPDLILSSRVNENSLYTGMDCFDDCRDKDWFKKYPHAVEYNYNSRGFRDAEWPDCAQELKQAVWCIGDSFTVGLGSPRSHTWPHVLAESTATRTINISLDGASNNWIARQALKIVKAVQPRVIVLHWSYLHRREGLKDEDQIELTKSNFIDHYNNIKDCSWPNIQGIKQFNSLPVYIQNELLNSHDQNWRQGMSDESLRLWHIKSNESEDIDNILQCAKQIEQSCKETKLIHSFIPGFIQDKYKKLFYRQFAVSNPVIPDFVALDRARDGQHYDIKTAVFFVQQIRPLLS